MAAARCMLGFITVIFQNYTDSNTELELGAFYHVVSHRGCSSQNTEISSNVSDAGLSCIIWPCCAVLLWVCLETPEKLLLPAHICSKGILTSTQRLWGKHRELSDSAAGPLVTPSRRGGGGTKRCVPEQLAAGRSPFCSCENCIKKKVWRSFCVRTVERKNSPYRDQWDSAR